MNRKELRMKDGRIRDVIIHLQPLVNERDRNAKVNLYS